MYFKNIKDNEKEEIEYDSYCEEYQFKKQLNIIYERLGDCEIKYK